MNAQVDNDARTLTVTCTVADLYLLDDDRRLYGTPAQGDSGIITQGYMASGPNFQDDRVVARLDDFLEAEGWDLLADYDADDPTLDDSVTITVPMDRREEVDGEPLEEKTR